MYMYAVPNECAEPGMVMSTHCREKTSGWLVDKGADFGAACVKVPYLEAHG